MNEKKIMLRRKALPSSSDKKGIPILQNLKKTRFQRWIFFRLQVERGGHLFCRILKKSFGRMDLSSSSDKKETLQFCRMLKNHYVSKHGPPAVLCPEIEIARSTGPSECLPLLPEDGGGFVLRNVLMFKVLRFLRFSKNRQKISSKQIK
jgi:hypothetical protein